MKFLKSILVFVALFALVGCAQAFPTAQVSDLPTETPTEVVQIVEIPATDIPTETPVSDPTAETSPTDVPTESAEPTTVPATEEPAAPTEETPLGSPQLKATNPANVTLASGKVQLVEFFAFW
ncbi:MAG: hypothetical protein HC806_02195 [Anaerolineae bacterium]|nr:hypothetical protein [Anaerolineae bacterium]